MLSEGYLTQIGESLSKVKAMNSLVLSLSYQYPILNFLRNLMKIWEYNSISLSIQSFIGCSLEC